jgi:hypothetical protein
MADEPKQEKKLIIDEDWKVQAQKEKEVLASEQEKAAEQHEKGERQFPPADFFGLISLLATQSLFAMGLIVEKEGQKPEPDLQLAKYNIDLLTMLEEKTKNNLSKEEEEMLQGTLYQLRMAYVKVSGGK